eukprot:14541514-Ditylum_brightwellii.AAC.1
MRDLWQFQYQAHNISLIISPWSASRSFRKPRTIQNAAMVGKEAHRGGERFSVDLLLITAL